MPRISEFYGTAIYMYYRDHAPPHFHAIYGEHEATIEISTARIADGSLPRRALSFVADWATAHRDELLRLGVGTNWATSGSSRAIGVTRGMTNDPSHRPS
jgi:hypothetical protein